MIIRLKGSPQALIAFDVQSFTIGREILQLPDTGYATFGAVDFLVVPGFRYTEELSATRMSAIVAIYSRNGTGNRKIRN
jgi:hypothetical protein